MKKIFQIIKTKIRRFIYNACQIEQIQYRLNQIDSKINQINRYDAQSFFLCNVFSHTVLICEFHSGHGECLPSYIRYFLALGYKVHVLINVENYIQGPFFKCSFPEDKVKFFIVDEYILDNDLFYKKLIWYQHVIMATSMCNWGKINLSILERNYVKKYHKDNFYFIEHNLNNYYKKQEQRLINKEYFEKRLFVIHKNPNHSWLIPMYFYDNVLVKKPKKNFTNFITVGALLQQQKNYDLLFDVMRELIDRNVRNFKVTIAGKYGDLSVFNMQGLDEYLDIRGMLSYDTMYECVEQSDFLLSLLDMSNEYSKKTYLEEGQTSGTNNLSIGFQTPCLYNEHFGKSFGFSDSNALLYSDNNLLESMLRAMGISDVEYQSLQDNLLQMKLELEAESLNNLEKVFGNVVSKTLPISH